MPSSTIKEWITERNRSAYRLPLFYDNGVLLVQRVPGKPDDLTRFPFYNVFIKNRLLFEPITLVMDFDPAFHYQPKKLSLSLYRDIGLWQILLVLNKCRSEVDFVGDKVYYLDPDQVLEYMSRMFVDEEIDTTIYGE